MVGAQSALGSPMTLAWLLVQFAVCALLIARSGYVLSRSADALADVAGSGVTGAA